MNRSIASGTVLWNRGSPVQSLMPFSMFFLDESSIPDLIHLQQTVALSLPFPEIFRLHDAAYFRSLFAVDKVDKIDESVIGTISRGELIGYSIICVPGNRDLNLGAHISLPESELKKVVHLQAVAVHPSCRGSGLQRLMIEEHLAVLKGMRCEHVCCTVSPKNPVSLRNMISQGFDIRGLKPMFAGWCRYIMHQSLAGPPAVFPQGVVINGKDLKAQLELLNAGLFGVGMKMNPDGFDLIFAEERKAGD
jgi:ribosomal protein S18 acetylase RimI-like enzyme